MADAVAPHGARAVAPLAEQAWRRMRACILDNVWPPGHMALERELGQWLGMSRTPVREAMVRLRDEGLVDVVPRHGLRVRPLSAARMGEIYAVLCALEVAAAEAVASDPGRGPRLDALERDTERMAAALAAGDRVAWAAADEAFHARLVAQSGNQTLIETVARFRDQVHRARMLTLALRPLPQASTQEHRALVDALRAGDTARAASVHRAHRARGAAELIPILQSLGGGGADHVPVPSPEQPLVARQES